MAGEITVLLEAELGLRLEDPGENVFTEAFKLVALNKAQKQAAQMLHTGYLTELENSESALDVSGGSYAITSLNATEHASYGNGGVFKGAEGVLRVSVDPGTAGTYYFATKVDIKDIKRTENTYLAGSDTNILWYIFSSSVYILCTTYTATVATIYYLKKPYDMTTSLDPLLNRALHPLICTLAEAICWAMDGKLDRRQAAYDIALAEIEILNARYKPAEGVGKGREILKR